VRHPSINTLLNRVSLVHDMEIKIVSFGRSTSRRLLFNEQDLRGYTDPRKQAMLNEISSYDKDDLLNTQKSTYHRILAIWSLILAALFMLTVRK
jgi:hypothetical protein